MAKINYIYQRQKSRRRLLPFGVFVATPQYCHSEPFAVMLSEAKDIALSIFNAMRDSSLPAVPRNDGMSKLSYRLQGPPATDYGS